MPDEKKYKNDESRYCVDVKIVDGFLKVTVIDIKEFSVNCKLEDQVKH